MGAIQFIIPLILFLSSFAVSQIQKNETDFLYNFLSGSYQVIGRLPDSNELYDGKIVMERSGDSLNVVRKIAGKEISAVGRIETATADNVKVLRVRFTENNRTFEITYLIHSDLDNYARLTGYVYLKNGGTKKPGLEALFIDREKIRSEKLPPK